jgi:hypothetical protein
MSSRRRRGKPFRIFAARAWRAAAAIAVAAWRGARAASAPLRKTCWRWTIRTLRDTLWRVDEWVHAQEVKIREEAEL